MTARAVIKTSCDFALLRYFNEIVSIEKFPASPRQVKRQVKPNNVYVSPDTGIIARVFVELVWLRSSNEVILSGIVSTSERFLENGGVDTPDNLKLKL